MRFVTFLQDGEQRVGMVERDGERIIDLGKASRILGDNTEPRSMLELIAAGDDAMRLAEKVQARIEELPVDAFAGGDTQILAPITHPRKNIFAVGLNYVRHNREFTGSDRLPEAPIIFTKAPTSVIGPQSPIQLRPDLTPEVDYEGELGVIIGKVGRDIPVDRAEEHIFGYTIINDVTARDLQKRTSQWFLGKSLDTFCPMGPYIVHKSVVGWPVKLDIRTKVNGEVRQNSNTELLHFDIPRLISTISAGITLEPGDIIATGTPEGVGMGFKPARFLAAGDVVEVEIEGLGTLRNPVV